MILIYRRLLLIPEVVCLLIKVGEDHIIVM